MNGMDVFFLYEVTAVYFDKWGEIVVKQLCKSTGKLTSEIIL